MAKKTGLTPSKLWSERVKEKSIQYYLQGNTTLKLVAERIAEELPRKPSISKVYTAIQEAIKTWEAENATIITQYKYIELRKIDNLEATYWDAWYRSCQVQTIIQAKKTPIAQEQPKNGRKNKKAPDYLLGEITETSKTPVGDPKFLTGVEWCINKRLEILGGIAPPVADADKAGTITTNTTVRQIIFRRRGDVQNIALTAEAQSSTISNEN